MQVWFVCGWQVKLCDPLVTHGPYLSALEISLSIIKRYTNGSFTLLTYIKSQTDRNKTAILSKEYGTTRGQNTHSRNLGIRVRVS